MAKVIKLNHIAIAIPEIEGALGFWQDALGLKLDHVEDVPSQKAQVGFLPVGESEIELVKPTESDTGVARFLEKKGAGLHHICFEVDDLDEMILQLKAKGVQMIDDVPKLLEGRKLAFIHPKSSTGVLVELYQIL
jgi:methylmalonyl-CoA/ethylmalonyl-CoA epimerase